MTTRISQGLKRLAPIVAALSVLLVVAGCKTLDQYVEDWDSVPKPKEPQANLVQYGHDVLFEAGRDNLGITERERLNVFLGKTGVGYGDAVHVIAGGSGRLTERRRERVRVHLALKNITATAKSNEFGIQYPPANAIRIAVRRHLVTLPGCPDWSGYPGRNFNNAVPSNFGCATATNLGLMVANPADLASGRPLDPADGTVAAGAVERYRKGETKTLTPEDVGVTQNQQKTGEGE